jgi:hypothetical protein
MMRPMDDRQRTQRLLKFALLFPGLPSARQLEADADWRLSSGNRRTDLRRDRSHGSLSPADPFLLSRLISSYVPQQNEHSCSLASITMLVNSVRAAQNLSAGDKRVTQAELLDAVGDDAWESAVGPEGEGVALQTLAGLVERSLTTFGVERFAVEVVHVDHVSGTTCAKVRQVLSGLARSPNHFLLANFLQSVYLGNPMAAIGHHAPVAGYDALLRRVFILDPDRHLGGPYWVSEERFLEGMATRDESCGKSRGCVSVRIA